MKYGFLTDMIGMELRKSQILAEKKFEAEFGRSLLAGHLTVLVLIQHNSGETQSALARAAGLDRSSLVPLLKQFEKQGLITRRKADTDARSNITEITPKGIAYIEEIKPQVIELEDSVSAKIGQKKYNQLVRLLQDFQNVIES